MFAENWREMEPVSPELVLVDPALRARLAELPSGPVFWPRPEAAPAEPVAASGPLLGRVLAAAAAVLIFLALPLLALAADLVREQPRLAPVSQVGSGIAQVGLEQHVLPDRTHGEAAELERGRQRGHSARPRP